MGYKNIEEQLKKLEKSPILKKETLIEGAIT
jgi:hypothetical protein